MNNVVFLDTDELRKIIAEEVGAAIKKAEGIGIQRKAGTAPKFDSIGLPEAVEYLRELGYKTTVKTLYGKTSTGAIPCRKVGRRIIFSREELREWVAGLTSTPTTRDTRRDSAAAKLSECVVRKTRGL